MTQEHPSKTSPPADDRPRIMLVHALYDSMAPLEAAFQRDWPRAEALHLFDQSLYADFNRSRELTPELCRRVESLLRHAESAGARAILFSGSLFGAAVEAAKARIGVPVLMAYEALIEAAFTRPGAPRLGLLATLQSTLDMIEADIARYAAAEGRDYHLETRCVDGAFDALLAGDRQRHDRLIVEAAARLSNFEVVMLGQYSMTPAAASIQPPAGQRLLAGPDCAVAKLRALIGD